jgi:hypothetical protein
VRSFRCIVATVTTAALLANAGCSFSYMPKSNGKIAMVVDNGKPAYAKDGRIYKSGIFGGDLDEAIRGNPAAEAELDKYQEDMTGWLACFLFGTGAFIGGSSMLVHDGVNNSAPSGGEAATEIGVFGAAIGLYVASVIFAASAQPHLFDAINIYNDGIDDGSSRKPVGPRVEPATAAPAGVPTGDDAEVRAPARP